MIIASHAESILAALSSSGGSGSGHRYWMILPHYPNSFSNATQVSEIEFRSAISGSDLTDSIGSSGAIANAFYGSGYEAANAFDNATGTDWASDRACGGWIGFDFGASGSPNVLEILIRATSGFPGQCFKDFTLCFSDDGSNWTPLFTTTASAFTSLEAKVFSVSDNFYAGEDLSLTKDQAHRYWRVLTLTGPENSSSGYQSLTDIELRNSSGTDQIPSGGSASASAFQNSTYGPDKAFDGSLSTSWFDSAEGLPQWVEWDFGSGNAKVISSYAIKCGGNNIYTPKGWRLQCSDDHSVWRTLHTVLTTTWTNNETKVFSL